MNVITTGILLALAVLFFPTWEPIVEWIFSQPLTFYLVWYYVSGFALVVLTLVRIERGQKMADPNAVLEAILKSHLRMEKTLNAIEQKIRPESSAASAGIFTIINGQKIKVVHMVLKGAESHGLSLEIVDALGNPAKVDGAPKWSLSDESLAALEVAEDGLSAKLASNGALGSFKVQCVADADLGEGVKEILAEAEFEVISGEAVSMKIVVS